MDTQATIQSVEKEIERLSLKEKYFLAVSENTELCAHLAEYQKMLESGESKTTSKHRKRSKSTSRKSRSKSRGRRELCHERRSSTSTMTTASTSKADDSLIQKHHMRSSSPGDYGMDEPLASHKLPSSRRRRRRRRSSNHNNNDETNIPDQVELDLAKGGSIPLELELVDTGISETNTTSNKEATMHVTAQHVFDSMGDSGIYTGTILVKSLLPHGKGLMHYDEYRSYHGDWDRGDWHGRGEMLNTKSYNYKGNFERNRKHGHGVCKFPDGRQYIGHFKNDQREGHGNLIFADGSYYQGNFVSGYFHGYGKAKFAQGGQYDGMWKHSKYHGRGTCKWPDGRVYKGEWKRGKTHGRGIEYRADGSVRHDGMFENDEPVR